MLKNGIFLFVTLGATILPALLCVSFISYKISSLIGGMIGCLLMAVFIYFNVGLKEYVAPAATPDLEADSLEGRYYTSGEMKVQR